MSEALHEATADRFNRVASGVECRDNWEYWRRQGTQRGFQLKRRYGMTTGDFDALLESQEWRCAACGDQLEAEGRAKHVDHCHKTNKIRGILCRPCNLGLGNFKDDPARLAKAIAYLERADLECQRTRTQTPPLP